MSVGKGNKIKGKEEHIDSDTPAEPVEEGLDDINSADAGGAPENVVSDTYSEKEDKKHGRNNAKPITGANPKTI